MLQPLAVVISGLAISAAIYLKPIEKLEKFAVVPMNDTMLAIVDKDAVRLCTIAPQSIVTAGILDEKGIQHAFGIICGHAFVTNDHFVNLTSQTGALTGYDPPKTN